MFLEGNMDLSGLFAMIIAIMTGPAIILFIAAVILRIKDKNKASKICWILGIVYLIISFGICGTMMMS